MKNILFKAILLISLSTLSLSGLAQIDTLAIYKDAAKVPSSKAKFPEVLALSLTYDYKDDASKVLAISYWIANNIDYDYKSFENRRAETYSSETVLSKHKALCGEYAQLFKEMCESVGVKAEIVGGYTRGMDFMANDTLFRSEHAWNAVKIDGHWKLLDLTYAAGSIVPAKQGFKKATLGSFGIPYKPKYHFVKKFKPQWLFVDPRKMILTHMPELPMYQLLVLPISMNAFCKGEKMVSEYLAEDATIDTENKLINLFSTKSNPEKWVFTGDEGLKFNPFNNRLRGFMYLHALDSLFEKYYDERTKSINADRDQIKQMKRYAFLSDSLLKQSMKDNDQEFFQLQKRSERWKETLKVKNKQLVTDLKVRVKQNNANIKTSNKARYKALSMSEFYITRYYQFKLMKPLTGVRRPKTPDSTAARQSRVLMHQQDSIYKLVCLKSLIEIDKINEPYNTSIVAEKVQTELPCLSVYEGSFAKVKILERVQAEGFSLTHNSMQFIDKKWMDKNNTIADSIKKVNVDKMVGDLYNTQLRFFDLSKQYTKSTKDRLNLIKMAKKGSGIDQKEDSLYQMAINRFTGDMLDFQSYLRTYTASRDELLHYLKAQNSRIVKLNKKLQKESDLENFRHNAYLEYRKKIRVGENERVKMALKILNKYSAPIDRSSGKKR